MENPPTMRKIVTIQRGIFRGETQRKAPPTISPRFQNRTSRASEMSEDTTANGRHQAWPNRTMNPAMPKPIADATKRAVLSDVRDASPRFGRRTEAFGPEGRPRAGE